MIVGTNIERFYHRAGILLVNSDCRWEIAAQSTQCSVFLDTLQNAVSQPNFNLLECMDIAKCTVHSLNNSSNLLSAVLLALSKLKKLTKSRTIQQPEDESSSSPSTVENEITALTQVALQKAPPDMSQADAPSHFHQIATSYGIEFIGPFVTGDFARRLIAAPGHYGYNMSIKNASIFLLRFFILQSSTSEASLDPLPTSALVAASKKRNAGLPSQWVPSVMNMCSTLYTKVRAEPATDLFSVVDKSDNLLKLLVMQWICLKDNQTTHATDSQQLTSTFDWLFSTLARVMERPVAPAVTHSYYYASNTSTSSVISPFILTLTALKQVVHEAAAQPSSTLTPSAGSLEAQISVMMHEMFEKAPLDFTGPNAAKELDRIATSGGIESIAPLLTSSFDRRVDNGSLSIKDAAKFILRFFVLDTELSQAAQAQIQRPATVGQLDVLAGYSLALAARKSNAGLPVRWITAIMTMCSTLYTRVQFEPVNFSLADDTAFCLLSLLTMHSLCLMSNENSNAGSIQKCISLAECVSMTVASAMHREYSNTADQIILQESTIPNVLAMIQSLIRLTEGLQEDSIVTSLRAAYFPLTHRVRKSLTKQVAALTPPPNSWVFPITSRLGQTYQYGRNSVHGLCGCRHCVSVQKFLQDSAVRQLDFTMGITDRNHVEKCVRSLNNPLLHLETIRMGSPHTLRVKKTQTAHSLFDSARKPWNDLLKKVESLHSVVRKSKEKLTASSSMPADSSSTSSSSVTHDLTQASSSTAMQDSMSSAVPSTDSPPDILLPLAASSGVPSISNPFVLPSNMRSPSSQAMTAAQPARPVITSQQLSSNPFIAPQSTYSQTSTNALSGHKRPREEIEIDSD